MKKKRQEIGGIVNPKTLGSEVFQNSILRPIIKTQHSILIAHYRNLLSKRKVDFGNMSKEQRIHIIKSSLMRDISFKNQIIGIVIGQFSIEEMADYQKNSSEYSKRILRIVMKRFEDSVDELI